MMILCECVGGGGVMTENILDELSRRLNLLIIFYSLQLTTLSFLLFMETEFHFQSETMWKPLRKYFSNIFPSISKLIYSLLSENNLQTQKMVL